MVQVVAKALYSKEQTEQPEVEEGSQACEMWDVAEQMWFSNVVELRCLTSMDLEALPPFPATSSALQRQQ